MPHINLSTPTQPRRFLAIGLAASLIMTTAATAATPLALGAAGKFVILSETGITDVYPSAVTGNVGTSPITGAADHLKCTEVTGTVDSVDATGPAPCSLKTPSKLGIAVQAMVKDYNTGAAMPATTLNLGAGNLGGLTIAPGVYSWTTGVTIPASVTLNGGVHDVWVFQVAKTVDIAGGKAVILAGKAKAANIFWVVAGKVTIGTYAKFEGNVLSKSLIALNTGATITGRLLSQTAVTLQVATVTKP